MTNAERVSELFKRAAEHFRYGQKRCSCPLPSDVLRLLDELAPQCSAALFVDIGQGFSVVCTKKQGHDGRHVGEWGPSE